MFKKITLTVAAMAMALTGSMAEAKFGSGGSFSRSSSFSSSRSSYSSYSRPSYSSTPRYTSTPSYTPTVRYNTSRYNSGSSYRPNTYRPSGGYAPYRPQVNNHYYNNSMNHPFGSPFFWMWAIDRHQPQTVVVNGGGGGMQQAPMVQGGDPGMYQQPDSGPGFFMTIFWGFINFAILVAFIFGLIWLYRKVKVLWSKRA